ncbi:unnamed protein product [Ostreobium quekettii]|uniref:Uncharacterized protein n=1 Tax=Ostreobium quekettii TaxID=121088 RepID=A0A8S1IUS9_9CHLO|nr:unnamed protein product [Ostreobium quekettii]
MPLAKVDTVKSDFDIPKDKLTGNLDFTVSKHVKFKGRVALNDKLVRAEVAGRGWSVAYDIPKNSATAIMTGRIEGADIKLTQFVPDMDWNVVPSPELELSTKLIKQDDWNDRLRLKYDFRSRKGSMQERVFIHKIHKVMISMDNTTNWDGATYFARSKLGYPLCHNLGLRYSMAGGPVVRYKMRPIPRLKIKTETAPKPQTFFASIFYRPELKESADVGLTINTPFGGSKTKGKKTAAGIALRWKF